MCVALASMLNDEVVAADLVSRAPSAKSVIWLFMIGGASHMETFEDAPQVTLKRLGIIFSEKTVKFDEMLPKAMITQIEVGATVRHDSLS